MDLSVLAAGAAGAVQTIPTVEFGREAKRWVGAGDPLAWSERVPLTVHEEYSLSWTSLLGLAAPAPTP